MRQFHEIFPQEVPQNFVRTHFGPLECVDFTEFFHKKLLKTSSALCSSRNASISRKFSTRSSSKLRPHFGPLEGVNFTEFFHKKFLKTSSAFWSARMRQFHEIFSLKLAQNFVSSLVLWNADTNEWFRPIFRLIFVFFSEKINFVLNSTKKNSESETFSLFLCSESGFPTHE